MRTAGRPPFAWTFLALLPAAVPSRAGTAHTRAELVAEVPDAAPGETIWIGIRLRMDRGWHTYWKNPGEAGQATRIRWLAPAGLAAGPWHWPTPDRFETDGIVSHGYAGETVLLATVTVPADLGPAGLTLRARVDWLECRESCIPGRAEVRLTLPRVSPRKRLPSPAFDRYRRARPAADPVWPARAVQGPDGWRIVVRKAPGPGALWTFFPDTPGWGARPAAVPRRTPAGAEVDIGRPEEAPGRVRGVLRVADPRTPARGIVIDASVP